MPLETIIGLPHLNNGPILQRARALQQTALISANGLSRWSSSRGWREWAGWRLSQLSNAHGLAGLCLDSAGFVAASRYGGFPWTIADYVALAAAYPFRWWASADYCVEPEIARHRDEVIDRLSRTIRANRDCRMFADDYGIADTLMPVIQGRRPDDYERCVEALWHSIRPGSPIGVGSMCRREIHGPEGLIAVIDHLDQILPSGIRLHALCIVASVLRYFSTHWACGAVRNLFSNCTTRNRRRRNYCRRDDRSAASFSSAIWARWSSLKFSVASRRLSSCCCLTVDLSSLISLRRSEIVSARSAGTPEFAATAISSRMSRCVV
ncbi:DUF7221 family queuine tRNA-ribosyltransferase-like protein [Sphingomonas panacis]|uniref:deazapurine DNA modification protein DpdA family protein n=1 Tax=Sphingomonas panacis TaxID=1560345 RepID=UPI000B1E0231|nr:hypothetical protein [Sphingomonas panacis]